MTPAKPSNYGPPRYEGDTRPPFAPGNDVANGNLNGVKHGALSERLLAETMDLLRPDLLERAPWLADELFKADRELLLRSMAIEARLSSSILAAEDISKVPSRQLEMRTSAARLTMQHLDRLGLSPRGHVDLRGAVADTKAAEDALRHLRDGRALEKAREARENAREGREARTLGAAEET